MEWTFLQLILRRLDWYFARLTSSLTRLSLTSVRFISLVPTVSIETLNRKSHLCHQILHPIIVNFTCRDFWRELIDTLRYICKCSLLFSLFALASIEQIKVLLGSLWAILCWKRASNDQRIMHWLAEETLFVLRAWNYACIRLKIFSGRRLSFFHAWHMRFNDSSWVGWSVLKVLRYSFRLHLGIKGQFMFKLWHCRIIWVKLCRIVGRLKSESLCVFIRQKSFLFYASNNNIFEPFSWTGRFKRHFFLAYWRGVSSNRIKFKALTTFLLRNFIPLR